MGDFSKAEIENIAKLANINLSDEQIASLSSSMASILSYMEEILELDVDNVPETTRMTEEANVWREDVVEPSLSQTDALRNGKSTDGYFVVPPILKAKK